MRDKMIGNRVMLLMGINMLLLGMLWIFSLLFFVQFYNTFNQMLFIVISIMVIGLPIGAYYFLYRPMKELDLSMRRFNEGNNLEDLKNAEYFYSGEMENLVTYLLDVTENMQDVKMTTFRSEYRALQNQINPHFLYNTLEAIRSDALMADVQEIADITEALATFFRYTISNLENKVTIEDELSNVKNYFKVQNYRFGDRIQLNIAEDYGSKLLKTPIPKLTLQPIIENAIIHGLEQKVSDGHVSIKISETQNKVSIDIIDDGVGMDDFVLERINKRMHHMDHKQIEEKLTKGGIALINVNNRIKLTFGEMYGLKVSSVKGYGTTVNVTLPKEEL